MNEMMVEPDVPNICSLQTPLPPSHPAPFPSPPSTAPTEPTHHPLTQLNSCWEVFAVLLKIPNCESPVRGGQEEEGKN